MSWVLVGGDRASGGTGSTGEGLDGAGDVRLRYPLHTAVTHTSPWRPCEAKTSQNLGVSSNEGPQAWFVPWS